MVQMIVFWGVLLTRIIGVGLFFLTDPLTAYLINAILDALDGPLYKHVIHLPAIKAQIFDKALDLWLYCFAYITLPELSPMAMQLLTATFVLRLVGQLVFFSTQNRKVLLFFPNFFEVTFLYIFITMQLGSWPTNQLLLLYILYLGKLIHEYILHHREITIFDHVLVPCYRHIKGKGYGRRAKRR